MVIDWCSCRHCLGVEEKMICISWRDSIESQLLKAAGSKAVMKEIIEEIKAGLASLWAFAGPRHCGYAVTRIESVKWGKEFVIVLGQGLGAKDAINKLLCYALEKGCNSVRVHVKRPGLMRIFGRFGFEKVGIDNGGYTILRKYHGR